jgi:hypothetical protein
MGSFSNVEPALRAYPVDIAFNVLSAVLVAFAILRHRLLDVSVVVRKGLLYSIPTIVIGAAYFLIISFVVNLFHAFARPQIFLLSLLVAVIMVVAAQPRVVQSAIDRSSSVSAMIPLDAAAAERQCRHILTSIG